MTNLQHFKDSYNHFINIFMLYTKLRWGFTLFLISIYIWSTYGQSYDALTYLIALYILQSLISFFTPKGLQEEHDPQIKQIECVQLIQNDAYNRKNYSLQEFNIQEQKQREREKFGDTGSIHEQRREIGQQGLWLRITILMIIGLICSRFKSQQINLFWPVLMMYFVILVLYTFIKIVKKMQKYNYTFDNFTKKLTFNSTQSLPK